MTQHFATTNPPAVKHLTIDEASEGQRVDNFLLRQLKGVPKSHVYRILRSGEVRVNKGRIAQDYRLALGDVVRLPPLRVANADVSKPAIDAAFGAFSAKHQWDILFEDSALLAINKPSGMAVHGGSGISLGVIEALRLSRPDAKFLELVHRLDRETSGVLLIAKKRVALVGMHAQLRGESEERTRKQYLALAKGVWTDNKRHVKVKLAKNVVDSGERRVWVDEVEGQTAHTIFTKLENFPTATLLNADLRTGRTHQIRVHLQHLGFPILGDDKYGDFALNKHIAAHKNGGLKRMFLHAYQFAATHPVTGEALEINAPLPADLTRYLNYLRHAK